MALCVEIQSGALMQSATPIDQCTGVSKYVLLHNTEYTSLPTLTDIFTMPLSEDLQQMFELGFILPVLTWITAWGYGVVINWFERDTY